MSNLDGSLRVWWIPQIPMEAFHIEVETIKEAKKLMKVLAEYDEFQYRKKVKPDYSNTGGLEVQENGEWVDWEDEDGNDIDHTTVGDL